MKRFSFLPLFLKIFFSVVIVLSACTLSAQSPTISSFTPASGPIGTAVTISGTNFSVTPANNIVWFGAVQATVNSATPSQLVVTVPAGATYKPLSVTVNGLMAFSVVPFNVRFAGSQIFNANSLAMKVDFTTGLDPQDVASCDVDSDGKPDLIVININSNTVSVYRNTSSPGFFSVTSFAPKVDFTTGSTPSGMAIGDIDGDGKLDLVVANGASTSSVSVFRNAGISGSVTTASFDARVDLPTGNNSIDVAISDIDGDGKQDIIITNFNSSSISIYRNIGTPGSVTAGSFEAKVDFSVDLNLQRITMGDIDGDGKPDMVVPNLNNNTVSVYRNNSTSGPITGTSFETKVDFTTGINPFGIALNDIDGDNKPDMIISNTNSNSVSIFRNTSTPGTISNGSFDTRIDFSTGSGPRGIDIGDIDGDGKPDIVVSNYNNNTVSLFRNKSTSGSVTAGSMENRVDFPTWTAPAVGTIGDIDCDGKPDIFVVNSNSNVISIFRNTIPPPVQPDIYSFSPASGPIGTTVTINGFNFSPTASDNIVWFGAVRATVTSATYMQLTVLVPASATYKPISVTVNGETAWARTCFAVTFPGTRSVDATAFAPKVDFTTGNSPSASSEGDIDGDGMPDLVVANGVSNTISVYRNISTPGSISTASFDNKVDFPTGSTPSGVALGDIDGDGKLDIIVSNWGNSSISIFRNTSNSGSITSGSLASGVDFVTGSDPDDIAIGDIDGDGKPDIAVVNILSGTVSIFGNKSYPGSITNASMTDRIDLITGSSPSGVAIGDLDGDINREIVVSNYGSNTVSIFKYINFPGLLSASSFGARVDFTTGINPTDVAINDIDGDGKLDLAVLNYTDMTVSIFRNTSAFGIISTGSFEPRVNFATGLNPCSIAVNNINGDSKPDLAVLNNGDNTVSIFCNNSSSGTLTSGSFTAKTDIAAGNNPRKITVGDLDGDGKQDLIVTNFNLNTISVIRNNIALPIPPVINSFAPTSGPKGTVVNISGSNFSATAANNIVWFGAVKAIVTAATSNLLTVTVPTGATYQPVTVTVNGLTAYSSSPFNITIPGTNTFNATSMASKVDFTTGMNPSSVAISDIDGDGKPDLIVTSTSASINKISVYRNISSTGSVTPGSFSPGIDFITGLNPRGIAIGDIDGDGKPDMAVANLNSNTVSIFRNTSVPGTITTGSFSEKVDLTTGSSPYGVTIGDIDSDGKPDLSVPNYMNSTVSLFRNISEQGTITTDSFEPRVDFPSGSYPYNVAIGDIDGDGRPDLAVVNWGSNSVSLLRNISSAGSITLSSFASKVDFTTGTNPSQVAIADIDGDSKPDLIVTNLNSDSFSIFRNISSSGAIILSSLAPRTDILVGPAMGSRALAIGDVDGDGKPDVVIGNSFPGNNKVYVFRNTSTSGTITAGSFASKLEFTTGIEPSVIAIGDIDGDGKADLLANSMASSISVIRNSLSEAIPPVINSFLPASGPIGTVVNISGSNFSATATDNIVWFGAVKALVTAATPNLLTVTVPTGATYQPVTVTVNGLTAYSGVPFNITFPSSTVINETSFISKVDFTAGLNPYYSAISDIDGDGKPDLVVTNILSNSAANSVSVYRNISTSGSLSAGSFTNKVDFTTATGSYCVISGDIDGDGKPDLIVTNANSNTVSVLRNTSTPGSVTPGSFADRIEFPTMAGPWSVAISDIDGDGKPDLVVTSPASSVISFFRNISIPGSITSGSFEARVDLLQGTNPTFVAIGDIDRDGKPDFAFTSENGNSLSIFRNISISGSITSGSFAAKVELTTGIRPYGVTIGDIDNDGKPDLAVTNQNSNTVSIFRNTSIPGSITAGSFANRVDFPTGTYPTGVILGEINGDGKPDLVVANRTSRNVSIFMNNGISGSITSESFSSKVDFLPDTNSDCVALGDLDGDGKTDLVSANSVSNTVSILRNTVSEFVLPDPPVITSFTPTAGLIGSTVTITGTGFSATPANNIVWFGAVRAIVSSATSTSLSVAVQKGTTCQPISVTVNGLTAYSGKPFNVTFPGPHSINANAFAARADFSTGTNPWGGSAIADLNCDGKPDLVVTNFSGNSISVLRNTSISGSIGESSFAPRVDFVTGAGAYGVAIGDIDGDGRPDLAVTNSNSNTVSIFRNTSNSGNIDMGSFSNRIDLPTGMGPWGVQIGDIDGDGKPDLVVTNSGTNTISLYRNKCEPGLISENSFSQRIEFTTGSWPCSVVIADIDSDGKPDITVSNMHSNTFSEFRNTSTRGSVTASSLAARVDFQIGTNPAAAVSIGLAIVDIDGDNKPDLAVTNQDSKSVSVFRNISTSGSITTGSFAGKIDFATGNTPQSVTAGDIDGDGKPDLAVTNNGGGTISVFKNTSTSGSINSGSFSSKVDFPTRPDLFCVALGDLDGDSQPDLVVVNNSSHTLSVLWNKISEQSQTNPPVISSFNPINGPIGTYVTINGINFSSTAANNIVWFGAVRATVTASTATQLTVTVPAGATYKPINVTVNGLTGVSGRPFNVVFPSSQIIYKSSFATKIDLNTGTSPRWITISDIDGDGKPDLIVTNGNSNMVSVYRNTSASGSISSGSFLAKVDFSTGSDPSCLAIDDIDGDGKPDLIVTNANSNTVSVFRNTSTPGSVIAGSFAPRVDFATGNYPWSVAVGDIDGDGKPDLSVANMASGTVSIFRNTSTIGSIDIGSFANSVDFATSGSAYVAIGDIDGDGKQDLAVTGSGSTVSVYRNTSASGSITSSSFAGKVDFTTGTKPWSIAIGDLDSDGKPDLAVTNIDGNTVSILRNSSASGSIVSGSFAEKVDLTTGTAPRGVSISDINGDSKPDLAITNYDDGIISIFMNTTNPGSINTGSFASKVDFVGSSTSGNIAIGDIDGDSKPDLVVVDLDRNTMSILRNTISDNTSVQPIINSFTPTSGPVGTTVTIFGMNFSTNSADNNVSFGGNQATVSAATATQLTVTVPNGSGNLPISVSVNGMSANSNNPFNVTSEGEGNNNNSFEFESSVLTLNGDGINDRLVIKNFEGYGKCNISVYNSRGVLIYSNKDYLNDWDLTINGRLLETGGYFYIAETDSGVYRGSFSILRPF